MSTQKNRKEVKYQRTVQSQAMSKDPKQNGLILSVGHRYYDYTAKMWTMDDTVIAINAINPRAGETTYLEMQIPIENIDDVIKALIEIKEELKEN